MKKFSLRHNYSTIELVGPLQHLKISIDYGLRTADTKTDTKRVKKSIVWLR